MADGIPLPEPPRPEAAVLNAALLFRIASHPMRLRALLVLSGGPRDSNRLANELGMCADALSTSLGTLLRQGGLVSRRIEGRQSIYALTNAGLRVVEAYQVVAGCDGPGKVSPQPCPVIVHDRAEDQDRPSPRKATSKLLSAATLLNHAAHPLRLQILLALAEGERDTCQLASDLGVAQLPRVSEQLRVLRSGTLISSRHRGRQNINGLTEAGLSLVQVVRATCSQLTVRRGGLTLWPEPTRGLDPTSPDGLSCLLKTFADPSRLRILNLLAEAGGVCVCHLHEALGLERRRLERLLDYPKKTGLLLVGKERCWERYRLSRPASHLYQSLIACFGTRLIDVEVFQLDWERLNSLPPCSVSLPGEGRGRIPHKSARTPRRTNSDSQTA